MKKTVTLFALLTVCLGRAEAQIPNASFENWTSAGSYSSPDGWDNFNSFTSTYSIFTCELGTTGAPHGSSYLKLTTRQIASMTVPGVASTGKYDVINWKPEYGVPFAARPAALTGRWQYMASGQDQGRIAVYLTRWNTTTNKREQVGGVEYDLPGMVMAWAPFSIPIAYTSGAMPDSMVIGLTASNNNITAGSYLYVDSLNFAGTVASVPGTASAKYSLTLSPNPARDMLSVDFGTAVTNNVQLWVMDMYGRVVMDTKRLGGRRVYSVDLHSMPAGLYFVKVQVGDDVQTQRLVVQ